MIINKDLRKPTKMFIYKAFNTIEIHNDKEFMFCVDLNEKNLKQYKHLKVIEE